MRVSMQGERGAFSEQAAIELCGTEITPLPCRTFQEVIDAVLEKRADCAVLPVENSTIGAIHSALEALDGAGLKMEKEIEMPIHHCLMAVKGAKMEDITEVTSHPAALAQCTNYLRSTDPPLLSTSHYDTAGAARDIAAAGDKTVAAIASARAAKVFGLNILRENIEDRPDNRTRFVLVRLVT